MIDREHLRQGYGKTRLDELYPLPTAFESARATRAEARVYALFGEMDADQVAPSPLTDEELEAMYTEWRERGLLVSGQ